MRSRLLMLALVGTTGCSIPFTTSGDELKAPCDRIAARAIQTGSLEDAKDLAARASECYAAAQNQ
jgi:hypothetical protein